MKICKACISRRNPMCLGKRNVIQCPLFKQDKKVHLCETCLKNYESCKAGPDSITFGAGGLDNICQCTYYEDGE